MAAVKATRNGENPKEIIVAKKISTGIGIREELMQVATNKPTNPKF